MRIGNRYAAGRLLAGALFLLAAGLRAGGTAQPPYRIVERNASLQILPSTHTLSVIDTIILHRMSTGHEPLVFGLPNIFEVAGAAKGNANISFKRGDNIIRFDDIPSDSEFSITFWYSGDLGAASELSQIGRDKAVLREEVILPQTDELLRRARITMIVPKDWYALTAGRLARNAVRGDSAWFTWESDVTMKNISWFCAGRYKTTFLPGEIPVGVHLLADDSTGIPADIASFSQKIVTFYSHAFGTYRFPKLDIIEVDNWVGGRNVLAVAAPSFVMVKRAAFETPDTFNQAKTVLPHEIAHQWWPLSVFINEEDAALLAEGMCEYSARLFDESRRKFSPRDSLGHHPFLRPLILKAESGSDVPLHSVVDMRNTQTHYLKSAYVHHMLRQMLGDSVFMELYREFNRLFAGKLAGQEEFRALAERLGGKNLGWFFDQWLERIALPKLKVYHAQSEREGSGWKITGRVRILGYARFTAFADVGVVGGADERDTAFARVWLGAPLPANRTDTAGAGEYRNDVPFETHLDSEPAEAVLDPLGNTLKAFRIPPKLSDLRDPATGTMIVGTKLHADRLLALARKDSAAMDLGGWTIAIAPDTAVTLKALQQERVILYGTPAENRVAAAAAPKFPNGFRGDSVRVGNSVLYDTSLALLQSIDNPYFENGLMCWVAPLSEKAAPQLLPFDVSWALVRGTELISSGTWDVVDENMRVKVKRKE